MDNFGFYVLITSDEQQAVSQSCWFSLAVMLDAVTALCVSQQQVNKGALTHNK